MDDGLPVQTFGRPGLGEILEELLHGVISRGGIHDILLDWQFDWLIE